MSGRIKCKAVSNYGIESDEKLFDLKIYETVQVNPGGPYNGRPNRPVVLEGAINTINYPGSTFAYQWRVKSGNTFADVTTTNDGNAEYTWTVDGEYDVEFAATVTTAEGLALSGSARATVPVESGRPTAIPGGPYRGGIAGGDFTPIQFEGNPPGFVEAEDIGEIQDWVWTFQGTTPHQRPLSSILMAR